MWNHFWRMSQYSQKLISRKINKQSFNSWKSPLHVSEINDFTKFSSFSRNFNFRLLSISMWKPNGKKPISKVSWFHEKNHEKFTKNSRFFLLFQELYSFMNENVNLLLDFWFSIGEFEISRKKFTKFFPRWFHEIFFRLSSTNLIQPVTKDIELQDKTPFLLYKIKVISRNFPPLFTKYFPDFTKFPLISRKITSLDSRFT